MGQHAKKSPKAIERTPGRCPHRKLSHGVVYGEHTVKCQDCEVEVMVDLDTFKSKAALRAAISEAITKSELAKRDRSQECEARTAVRTLLSYIGEDPDREGLKETPRHVVKAWDELTQGYGQDPATILATDFDGAGYDEMVVCRNVEFASVCEHHLLPFLGVAHVAYVPRTRVVGLSKMGRLVDCFARRLQIQEKMTLEIAEAMRQHLNPRGVGVTIIAKHLCMACRGVRKQQSEMVTSCLLGVFKAPAVRAEFFNHCRNGGH